MENLYAERLETNDAITVASEVDRVYLDTYWHSQNPRPCLRVGKILVEKQNSRSTVVWNPWINKARQMSDFGNEEYLNMVCVESGNVGKNKLTLAPGKSSTLTVKLSSATIVTTIVRSGAGRISLS